jgi:origin recognition complex subunit 6
MSNVEQSLSLLLPSLSEHLPSELVALSRSLLAQSRNKAGNLKSEEEIARPYACSEIACKRLGTKLRLPVLHGRPPCAPRVYKKLLTFLEQALPANLPTKPTQDSPKTVRTVASAQSTPKRPTERSSLLTSGSTPNRSSAAFVGKVGQSGARRDERNDDGAPPWAMSLIRRLCKTLLTPLLPPHVYTGLCVVIKLADLETMQADELHTYRREVTCLTLALFFLVLSKMQRGKVSSESYLADCERACAVANRDDANNALTKEHVDEWIKKVSSEAWAMGQEWWSSVPEDVFDRVGKSAKDESEDDNDIQPTSRRKKKMASKHTERDPEGTLLPGLGTMMQESVDWLSEDKEADYLDWRAGIEKRLAQMENVYKRTRARATEIKTR